MFWPPAFTNRSAYFSGSEIIKCASKYAGVSLRIDSMKCSPKLMFGTKWPSITSKCRKSAPVRRTSSISRSRWAKSAESTEAAICGEVVSNGFSVTLVENVQCREMPLLQKLQRRAAARADVADAVGEAQLLDGGGAVAAADDADGVVTAGGVGNGFGDLLRAVFEG